MKLVYGDVYVDGQTSNLVLTISIADSSRNVKPSKEPNGAEV